MIRVSMEVRDGTALSRATVQAESIREAVSTTERCSPGCDVRVTFPIDPKDFFIEDPEEGNSWTKHSGGQRSIDKGELNGQANVHPFERSGEQQDA